MSEKIEVKCKAKVNELKNGSTRDGGCCQIVHELGALADAVLHRFGLPSQAESYVLDGKLHGEQSHGGCDSVGVGNDGLDVDAIVVEGVGTGRPDCLSHYIDDFRRAHAGAGARGVGSVDTEGQIGGNL